MSHCRVPTAAWHTPQHRTVHAAPRAVQAPCSLAVHPCPSGRPGAGPQHAQHGCPAPLCRARPPSPARPHTTHARGPAHPRHYAARRRRTGEGSQVAAAAPGTAPGHRNAVHAPSTGPGCKPLSFLVLRAVEHATGRRDGGTAASDGAPCSHQASSGCLPVSRQLYHPRQRRTRKNLPSPRTEDHASASSKASFSRRGAGERGRVRHGAADVAAMAPALPGSCPRHRRSSRRRPRRVARHWTSPSRCN